MTIRKILIEPNKILRQKSISVENNDLRLEISINNSLELIRPSVGVVSELPRCVFGPVLNNIKKHE